MNIRAGTNEKTIAGAGSAWNIRLVIRKANDMYNGFLETAKKQK